MMGVVCEGEVGREVVRKENDDLFCWLGEGSLVR